MPSRFESTYRDRILPAAERAFGVTVRLCRGPRISSEFTARRHNLEHKAIGAEYGLEVRIVMRDFLLPVASLLLDEETIEPKTGDRILEGSEIFEIQPPDENSPSVELQPGGFEYLVHAKRVE